MYRYVQYQSVNNRPHPMVDTDVKQCFRFTLLWRTLIGCGIAKPSEIFANFLMDEITGQSQG